MATCSYYRNNGVPNGLPNIGNVCFMNATLQCLYHTQLLRDHYLKTSYDQYSQSLSFKFQNLLNVMKEGGYNDRFSALVQLKRAIGKVAPRFLDKRQEDAHELLTFLLDGLHEDVNTGIKQYVRMTSCHPTQPEDKIAKECWDKYQSRNASKIIDLFHGQVRVQLTCAHNDAHKEILFEPINQLALPLPNKPANNALYSRYKRSEIPMHSSCHREDLAKSFTLRNCLELYTEEKICVDQGWFCSNCNVSVPMKKKTELWKMPEILIIHLKRFSVKGYAVMKRDDMVDFADLLDVGEYVAKESKQKDTLYELYAVINHYGELEFGHYDSCIIDHYTWYRCDDLNVNEMRKECVKTRNAYVLFYKKREKTLF